MRDELEKDSLAPKRTKRIALVVPRSSFLSSSSPSSSFSSSSFEIEEEYLVVERIIEKQGEEQKQDEDDAFVVVATLDYVVADKLQGEVLHGGKEMVKRSTAQNTPSTKRHKRTSLCPRPSKGHIASTCVFCLGTEVKV